MIAQDMPKDLVGSHAGGTKNIHWEQAEVLYRVERKRLNCIEDQKKTFSLGRS